MKHILTLRRRNPRARTAVPLALLAGAPLALGLATPAAGAKTVTLRLFSQTTSSMAVDAQGHPLAPNAPPAVGDTFDNTGLDFVGNHRHHAARANGSDHLRCTITAMTGTGPTARCNGQIAIGGSMILANDESFILSANAPRTPINGGTGIYRRAHGLISPTDVGRNTDFIIRITY